MTIRINTDFIDYVDYIDIAQEALKTAPKKLFEKMIRLIINSIHTQEIELERFSLQLDDMHTFPVDNIEEFYDTLLNAIDDIKLFKKKLEQIKDKDILFEELYIQVDKLYTSLIIFLDRIGQLEVRILQENKKSA
ncbi:hypothetical protein MLC35_07415 [Sulfurimonas sp. NW7]|uniref:hypothetical protein n=1 Tax=Sulfurimonas TaxID=202746 RepID=UPI00125FD45D|nr:hypothetical protein [Sulfurimonas hydrogeniphila]